MESGLGRDVRRDFEKYLTLAYDGEIPPPYYWNIGLERRHIPAVHRPGEIDTVLPYQALPPELIFAAAISIDQLDEMIERRARREEHAG